RRAVESVRWMVVSSSTCNLVVLVGSGEVAVRRGSAPALHPGRDRPPGSGGAFHAGDVRAYCTRVPLQPGLAATVALDVTESDTALAFRSGDVPVLATPRLIALCEEAAMAAVADVMPEGHTNVGMRVQIDHLAPTAVGQKVTAEATLEKVEGRRLTFTVSATDERGLVAAGKVTRVMVEVDRFLDKLLWSDRDVSAGRRPRRQRRPRRSPPAGGCPGRRPRRGARRW